MMAEYGIPKEKISVIPLPLPSTKYELVGDGNKENDFILYVGWIEPRKGLHVLIKAMRNVVRELPNIKLYVIGAETNDRQYFIYVKNLIKQYKLESNVLLLGKKTNTETLEFIRRAKFVVVPEQWEIAIPIALTEAMLLEKATVCSHIGGIPSFIRNGENGFIVDPKNPREFAEKIVWLLKNPQSASKMGKLARKHVIEICNEGTIYKELSDLYKLVSKRH